jgi:hypothetical protein
MISHTMKPSLALPSEGFLSRVSAYWARAWNGLVYEQYFPKEVHACARRGLGSPQSGQQRLDLVEAARLSARFAEVLEERGRDVTGLPEEDRLARLRQNPDELPPLCGTPTSFRIALDKLQSIVTVRIVEASGGREKALHGSTKEGKP